ncbi:MAG TPA: ribosome biogenesis GTPase Der [Rickettsiales bacterium]|nr:ribosome biogenesis GTPase Der [Rickettsiales bacterium]
MPFTIAIVGRPNVGKSSLFNKLVGRKIAIVNDFAGVTRDRKIESGHLGEMEFDVVDTAGLEYNLSNEQLESRMVKQTEIAVFDSDLCLFMVDARSGIHPADKYFASWLRKKGIPTVLVANKCEFEKSGHYTFDTDFYKLGLGEPVPISAEHNNGFNLLYDAIEPFYDKYQEEYKDVNNVEVNLDTDKNKEDREITIAVVGRPNAGKSTLINTLLKDERVITGSEAGITRDAIAIKWKYKDKDIKLIDTAGIRKKHNIDSELEKFAVEDSFRAVRFAQIVIMMIDSTTPFDVQDLAIANLIVQEGRGLIFALNKWDTVPEDKKHKFMNNSITMIEEKVPLVKGCPIVPISALYSKNIDKLVDACLLVYKEWNEYIKTSDLNNWLRIVEKEHTPPLFRGKVIKLKYMTQAKKRPPTFVLFTNSPEKLEKTTYSKYLVNRLREDFGLKQTIVRLLLRKADNPYDKK